MMLPDPTEVGGWYLMVNMAAIILVGELVGWAYFRSITPRDEHDMARELNKEAGE